MSTKWPSIAAAAAICGETRCVRPPRPWRPSKLRFEVEAQRSPGARMSGFMPRHIEQPAVRQSKPALRKTSSSPSRSACAFTRADPGSFDDPDDRVAAERALAYMALAPGTPIRDIRVDRVFIGSCTNSRIEDLRAAAAVVRGQHVHPSVRAMVVPGSAPVKLQAEAEGLDRIFLDAGFEWRRAGCSMCLGMNPDILAPGERCASTSNRNFEGRQGAGGRTHLVSPTVAAATAIAGHFTT